jgi:pyruvate ferredoxin oxidoreductase gamma subunit
MKTAGRILGTAAFRQGYYAQDSPVYGAERRGAPMIAFTRFDSSAILERGIVSSPDLVVIADVSLLDDPLVKPLQGLVPDGAVLVNAARLPHLNGKFVHAHDFTGLALHHAGSTAALSVALGAAASKLSGLELRFVEAAVREELHSLKLDPARVDKNVDLARISYNDAPASFSSRAGSSITLQPPTEIRLITPVYEGPWAGTASVVSSPNTPQRKTGDWRVMRPGIDLERCTHCWVCFIHCPDGAIGLGPDDVPWIDYGVCKGCLICAEECPVGAVEISRESEAGGLEVG